MAILAALSLVVAIGAFASDLHMAEHYAVDSVHSILGVFARRIATVYRSQIGSLSADVSAPLSRRAIAELARPLVVSTIGDNEGIDGGLYLYRGGLIADAPQPVESGRERAAIAGLATTIFRTNAPARASVASENGDIVAIDAVALADRTGIAFARERISASVLHGGRTTLPLVAAAIALAALVIGLGSFIVWRIRRDVRVLLAGIAQLERDPTGFPALRGGDFGSIGRAVAEMAQRRAHAEQRARQSERLAAIGRLAANTAHEIRNPLNALRLQIAVLHRRFGDTVDAPVAKLDVEIDRIDGVVRRMLETRSDEPLVFRSVDLREVAKRAITTLETTAAQRGHTIAFSCSSERAIVAGDEERLVQLIGNIVGNAVDVAPAHSVVDVHVKDGPAIEIVDRGTGVAAEDLPRLFEPFFTKKPRGTGLGLAIAHEIARAHGARIDVRSENGETSFTVVFA